jgi:hypothetical protein
VIDRASTFSNPGIIQRLTNDFIPVAIDQAYQRRQKDNEGVFYRKIVAQSPRKHFEKKQTTTQGLYAASPDGTMLGYNNNRTADRVGAMLDQALKKFNPPENLVATPKGQADLRYNPPPPKGGLIVRVHGKVLGGYEKPENEAQRLMQKAISQDNLWITKEEHQALVKGQFPRRLQQRIARFHLIDNTRGEPPMWHNDQVRSLNIVYKNGKVTGTVALSTPDRKRGYTAQLLGHIEKKDGEITRFDLVAKGLYRGQGTYTRGGPKGTFPFAVSFRLVDGTSPTDAIPPQGSRGWMKGYIKPDPLPIDQ